MEYLSICLSVIAITFASVAIYEQEKMLKRIRAMAENIEHQLKVFYDKSPSAPPTTEYRGAHDLRPKPAMPRPPNPLSLVQPDKPWPRS